MIVRFKKNIIPYIIVFFSGACALVYEIVWMRAFTVVFGLSIYATTAVLCAFMAGLSIGSYIAPKVIERWKKSFWSACALLEIGIGLGAILVFYSLGPCTNLFVAISKITDIGFLVSFVRFFSAFLVMLIPTIFMGLTLPIIIHACKELAHKRSSDSNIVGLLYGFNTVGAAMGCFAAGFFLIYKLGLSKTIFVAVGVNFLLAIIIYLMYIKNEGRNKINAINTSASGESTVRPNKDSVAINSSVVLVCYGLIGFISLAYELCWFRILKYYLHGAGYSFSLMLILYLCGIGLGSFYYSIFLDKKLNLASLPESTKIFGFIQMLMAILGALTLPLYVYLPTLWRILVDYLGAGSWIIIILQKSIISGLIIFPLTFLMGISFPLVTRIYCRVSNEIESKAVGRLYAANTFGAIVGILMTVFVLFDGVGIQTTIVIISSISLMISALFIFKSVNKTWRTQIVWGLLAALFIFINVRTPPRMLISNLKKYSGNILFYKEAAADITFVHEGANGRWLAFHDGRGTSSTLPLINLQNRLQAYSTMMLNPEAKDVLVISMGCGNTASAYSKFPIRRLDIVDISSGPFEAAEYFYTNQNVLNDPRVHTYIDDGRSFLLTTKRKYDIIEIELPSMPADGVVNLYTKEFYEIAKSKLKPGGVLSQWIDIWSTGRETSYTLINTMLEVFPQSILWSKSYSWWINGVNQEHSPAINYNRVKTIFSSQNILEDMESVSTNFQDIVSYVVSHGKLLKERVHGKYTITDDLTIVDFLIPKQKFSESFGGAIGYYSNPLREIFINSWKSDKINMTWSFGEISFYDANSNKNNVERSLKFITREFPKTIQNDIIASSLKR